jgi:hypothetical protein
MITRRHALQALSSLALILGTRNALAAAPSMIVHKDPNCGCCSGWVEHVREAGFTVEVRDVPDLTRVKTRLGVPADLAGCHTAEVAGYAIEGHVPAAALRRFLNEKPKAKGLAVPGMPVGSPGMEVPDGQMEEYVVVLFGPQRRTYARFRGAIELPQ